VAEVAGRADAEPLLADQPDDPRNRRISIVLLRAAPGQADDHGPLKGQQPGG
jgi:chemotaxis protein MotB